MRSAYAVVDVESVRARTDRDYIRAELVKDARRDLIRGAVGTVDDDAHALEIEPRRESALAELDVAPRGIFHAPCFSEVRRARALEWRLDLALDLALRIVRQLFAVARKELDPVILI